MGMKERWRWSLRGGLLRLRGEGVRGRIRGGGVLESLRRGRGRGMRGMRWWSRRLRMGRRSLDDGLWFHWSRLLLEPRCLYPTASQSVWSSPELFTTWIAQTVSASVRPLPLLHPLYGQLKPIHAEAVSSGRVSVELARATVTVLVVVLNTVATSSTESRLVDSAVATPLVAATSSADAVLS